MILQYKLAMVVTRDYERILIGSSKNILLKLEGKEDVELFCDETRPFGTYLLQQETDTKWNTALANLEKAQDILHKPALIHPVFESVVSLERNAQCFFEEKCDKSDPIATFVAMRIWYAHWSIRGLKDHGKSKTFSKSSRNLIRPFTYTSNPCMQRIRISSQNPIFKNCMRHDPSDSISITYITNREPSVECILVDNSIIPLERFYKSQIEKYTKYIIECKVCNNLFIADTLRFELCSDECRERAAEESQLQRMKDPSSVEIKSLLASTRSFWNRRLNKIKQSSNSSSETIQNFEIARQIFRKEASSMYSQYKCGDISAQEFTDWLFLQERNAESLYQELMVTER